MDDGAYEAPRVAVLPFVTAVALALSLAGCSMMGRTGDTINKSNYLDPSRISIEELDHITKGFADRYATVVGSAVDVIKRNNTDATERRIAHRIKLNGVLAINDIVWPPIQPPSALRAECSPTTRCGSSRFVSMNKRCPPQATNRL